MLAAKGNPQHECRLQHETDPVQFIKRQLFHELAELSTAAAPPARDVNTRSRNFVPGSNTATPSLTPKLTLASCRGTRPCSGLTNPEVRGDDRKTGPRTVESTSPNRSYRPKFVLRWWQLVSTVVRLLMIRGSAQSALPAEPTADMTASSADGGGASRGKSAGWLLSETHPGSHVATLETFNF